MSLFASPSAAPLPSPVAPSFRNRLRNASLTINQRGVSGTVTLAAGQYGHDGFKAGSGGCTYTFARTNGVTALTITAGTLVQAIEGGFYLPEGGTYTLSWLGSAQGRVNGGASAASPITVTGLTPDANATIEWGIGTLALPMFEPGSRRTAFEYRDDELRRCQRYFQLYSGVGTLGFAFNATSLFMTGRISVAMRESPTITLLKTNFIAPPSGYDLATSNNFVGGSGITASFNLVGYALIIVLNGFSGLNQGASYMINSPDTLLSLSSEL